METEANATLRVVNDSVSGHPLVCSHCGNTIPPKSFYTRRTLPSVNKVAILCTTCEPFRLVSLPLDSVHAHTRPLQH
jgi:hypothetical protein